MKTSTFYSVLLVALVSFFVSFGYGQASGVSYKWTKSLGGTSDDTGYGVVTDSSGNIFITGSFKGTVNFGSDFGATDIKTSAGYGDVFVTKISYAGTYAWTRIMGGISDNDVGYGIATDSSGNAYITGEFWGTVDFGLDFGTTDIKTSVGYFGAFITKINANGTYGWTRTIRSSSNAGSYDIALDASANIYVIGGFYGVVDFGMDFGATDIRSGLAVFITKVNADLSYGWTKSWSGSSLTFYNLTAIAATPAGDVYTTGYSDFEDRDMIHHRTLFFIKIDSYGSVSFKTIYNAVGNGVATDAAGNVMVTGEFSGTIDFGYYFGTTDVKTSANGTGFVMRINADGTFGWTKTLPRSGEDVTSDARGNIYVMGHFWSTSDFGLDFGTTDIKVYSAPYGTYLTRISPDATYGWTRALVYGDWRGGDITADASGNAYIRRNFSGTANFGFDFGTNDTKSTIGDYDAFLTKLEVEPAGLMVSKHAVGDFDGDGKDEVAMDFGPMGAWIRNNGAWTVLTLLDPECMLAADINGDGIDEILISFGASGLWVITGGVGQGISSSYAESMTAGDVDADGADEVVCDFGADGLWLYNGGGWTQLSAANPDEVTTADVDNSGTDEIAGDFGTIGLWLWKAGAWTQLSGANAEHLTVGKIVIGDYLLCDFGKNIGLWIWTEFGAWTHVSGADPDYMITADTDQDFPEEIFADFGPLGLWLWTSAVWSQPSGLNAVFMIRAEVNGDGKDDLVADFGAVGIWLWSAGGWTQLGSQASEYLMAADLDGDAKDEIIVDFGASGLWMWNAGVWSQLSANNPD